MNKDALFTSKRDDWCTPPQLLSSIGKFERIGLDPCSNDNSLVDCNTSWTKKDNGLSKPWVGHGLVFVNPPYGKEISYWLAKCCIEAEKGAEIIGLFPARVDTRWFQDMAITANRTLFIRGRLKFLGAKHSAPFPSVLCYWGDRPERFEHFFEDRGAIAKWPRKKSQ